MTEKGHLPAEDLARLIDGDRSALDEAGWCHLANCRSCFAAYAEAVRFRDHWLSDRESFEPSRDVIEAGMGRGPAAEPAGGGTARRGFPPGGSRPVLLRLGPVLAVLALLLIAAGFSRWWPLSRQANNGQAPIWEPIKVQLAQETALGMVIPGIESVDGKTLPVYRSPEKPHIEELRTANRELLSAYREDRSNADLAFWLIGGHLAGNDLRSTETFLENARRMFPGDERFSILAAVTAFKRNDIEVAETILRGVLRREPDHPEARFNLVYLLAQQGRVDEARHLASAEARQGLTPDLVERLETLLISTPSGQ